MGAPHCVLVCGGRDYDDVVRLSEVLHLHVPAGALVIEGGHRPKRDEETGELPQRSADWLTYQWCEANGVAVQTERAEWRRYGPSAGPRRNQRMLDKWQPELAIAAPGGRGTADMVRRAKAAGVPVVEVPR